MTKKKFNNKADRWFHFPLVLGITEKDIQFRVQIGDSFFLYLWAFTENNIQFRVTRRWNIQLEYKIAVTVCKINNILLSSATLIMYPSSKQDVSILIFYCFFPQWKYFQKSLKFLQWIYTRQHEKPTNLFCD